MTDKLVVHRGRIGDTGTDGINGAAPSDIRKSILNNAVLDCLYNNNLDRVGDLTFARVGEASIVDRYGNYSFVNGEDFTNEILQSEDFSLTWDDFTNQWTITATGQSDPLGGSDATHITLDSTTSPGGIVMSTTATGLTASSFYTLSFWIKVVSGTFTAVHTQIGSDVFQIDWTPSSSFVRVRITVGSSGTSVIIDINPVGTSGSVFALFGVQFEKNSNLNTYLKTTGSAVTASNPGDGHRANQDGYLFESTKTNLISWSEDLANDDWAVSGAALSAFTGEGAFGNTLQNILLTFSSSSTATITKTVTLVEDTVYEVSLFAKLISGTITQISAAIGNSADVAFEAVTSEWVRVNITVTAGVGNDLVLTIISPSQDAIIAIEGFQVEIIPISSYIRTADFTNTRPFDLMTVPYEIGRPDEAWTIFFVPFQISSDATRFVFDNGLSGSDSFAAFYTNNILHLVIGSVTTIFTAFVGIPKEIFLVYDGSDIDIFVDGVFVEQKANAGSVSDIGTTLNIGGDGTSANGLNAQLSKLRFYDFNSTSIEIEHISGEFT